MKITIIQPDIIWENKEENLKRYEKLIKEHSPFFNNEDNIIILPEMFTTGFTMNPESVAEEIGGMSTKWISTIAEKYNSAVVGSLAAKNDPANIIITKDWNIIKDGKYYNRLYFIQPNGINNYYNKKHLFRFSGEDKSYTPGSQKVIVEYKGYRILLLICYDLRFPVWSRYQDDYDMIIYVANWPKQRSIAWKTLLQARAIENQCYVIGVNRVGIDNNNNEYSGDSSVISPTGDILWQASDKEIIHTLDVDKNIVIDTRNKFPFYLDADKFKF